MQETYAGRIEIIGVSGRDEPEAMAAFVDTHDVGAFPHIVDLDLKIWMCYDVASQPGFVFIDDDVSTSSSTKAPPSERLCLVTRPQRRRCRRL